MYMWKDILKRSRGCGKEIFSSNLSYLFVDCCILSADQPHRQSYAKEKIEEL